MKLCVFTCDLLLHELVFVSDFNMFSSYLPWFQNDFLFRLDVLQ